MNFQEAMQFVRAADALGCTPGLSRVTELLERLGNPQNKLHCIHIAGTNGKGSTAAMLAEVLQAAGYRTGLYTTPHLVSYRERIRINREEISEEDFCCAAETVRRAAEGMQETPSEFERFTPMAFVHFLRKQCDIVVIETGMGGRLDATNVIRSPELNVITHIAMDHMEYLGDTLAEIAAEKAGIITPDTDVVMMKQSDEAERVIRTQCQAIPGTRLFLTDPDQMKIREYSLAGLCFDYRERKELFLPMAGSYQQSNVMTALDALDVLRTDGWKIPEEAVRSGLAGVHWPARFEILQKHPLVLLDGAHNADGARALAATLDALLPGRRPVIVMGVLADKEYREMLQLLLPRAGMLIAAEPDQIRALPAEQLLREAENCAGELQIQKGAGKTEPADEIPILRGGTVFESLQLACRLCPPDGVICIAGSLYQAGEARSFFQNTTVN
ncbi:MAG: bifunctional folylpolyglutamate synthase/dihydrofolate synthase [Eubacterium sp.]|nr:bifunctional folylpolyglutamate synthase/dihydrofolate synthase [Eubacterium sp.]